MKNAIFIILLILTFSINAQTKIKKQEDTDKKELKQVEEKQELQKQENGTKQLPKEKNGSTQIEEKEVKIFEQKSEKQKIPMQQSKQDRLETAKQQQIKRPLKVDELQRIKKWKNPEADSQIKPLKFKKYHHKPLTKLPQQQQINYQSPIYYHYTVHPVFLYRGLWVRYYFIHDNGFFYYNGYPYYVYNNHLHRYSFVDPGFYDLVDSRTDEVYATFYGRNLKESYDRAALLRDFLNNEEGYYRYFCAERFEYDPDYYYGWDPTDFPDWYWE